MGTDEDYPKLVVFLTPKAKAALKLILKKQPAGALEESGLDKVLALLEMRE